MDAGVVKQLIEEQIPFVKKTGVLVDELTATRVRLRLPHDPTNLSPMGTLHAGAIFTLAETCAGALGVMALGARAMVVAKGAEVRFRRPGKSELQAAAQLTPVDTQRALDSLAREGKLDVPITVEIVDAHKEPIATATVTLSARRQ
jgi:uncharacterized protein (TIGR00369 family)